MPKGNLMERKEQNLELIQKFSAKSEECFEMRSQKQLFPITRTTCAAGSNMDTAHCNSRNSSCQNLSYKEQEEEDEEEDVDAEVESEDVTEMGPDIKDRLQHFNGSVKRKSQKQCDQADSKLKAELSKYKKELKEYNNTTKDLEEKYLKINYELNEMQEKHDRFVANRKYASNDTESYSDSNTSSSTGSEYSLKRKYTQIFHRGNSFMTMVPGSCRSTATHAHGGNRENEQNVSRKKRNQTPVAHETINKRNSQAAVEQSHRKQHSNYKRKPENKENEPPMAALGGNHSQTTDLKDIYKVLKNVLDTNQKTQIAHKSVGLKELQTTIVNLQNEQAQFRNIIQQQQSCLNDYHSRCIKAQHIMQTQQLEIEKLNSNNQQLESEISNGIDQLRVKIDAKLRDVSHLPQMMRDEQAKYEKTSKENSALAERLRALQNEAAQLKLKIEELGRRKTATINRLKAAERDLKIFKNYNTALKHEKRKLHDEMQNLKEQFENVQNNSKRTLARQREQNEKQRRELQKRVFELELKLSRSQNSTTSLIQERDSLIAELQTQLNTLVHNFEVSQKHIRVLRRHIYSMSGGNVRGNGNHLMNEQS